MIVSDITDLTVSTVLERGVPNKECIAIQVNQAINLGQYGVMVGQFSGFNSAVPFRDNLFWFGDGIVEAGDWIFIYTGLGTPTKSRSTDDKYNVYSTFWGRSSTIFANSNIVPMLFRLDAVNIPLPPGNSPQLGI